MFAFLYDFQQEEKRREVPWSQAPASVEAQGLPSSRGPPPVFGQSASDVTLSGPCARTSFIPSGLMLTECGAGTHGRDARTPQATQSEKKGR